MATHERKILVLGGGITGLCAAWKLSRLYRPQNVVLLEASGAAGGAARTENVRGFLCDLGPNGYLDREPQMRNWVRDLGLTSRLVKANEAAAKRFVLLGGKLKEVKPPPAFLLSSLLSLGGRMALAMEPFKPKRKGEEPESIWDFAARRVGPEAADKLVAPMVTGIFGGDAKALSVEHCFPRLVAMEREHGSLLKGLKASRKDNPSASPMGPGGTLTTFDAGMGVLAETAAASLGGQLRLGQPAVRIEYRDKQFTTITEGGDKYVSEGLVVATPAWAAADAVMPLEKSIAAALGQIPYIGITVLAAGFRREDIGHDLNGFGFLVPQAEKLRTLGCIWTSSIFPHEAPKDYVLLRAMYGGALDPGAMKLTDREILDQFMRDLSKVMQLKRMPDFVRIYRWFKAIPQYTLEHGKRLRGIEQAEAYFKGLAFAGNAYRGVGLNDCTVSAQRACDQLQKHLPL